MNTKFDSISATPKDCFRYWKILTGRRESWSDKERYLLLIAHQKYKNRWAEVAQMLNKQSRNFVKNRFYTLFRKIRNRIKNGNINVTSLLDLLEILYMILLIEQYCKSPAKKVQQEKNYTYKLVQKIDKEKVAKYKIMLKEVYKNKANMEQLFEKYSTLYCSQSHKNSEYKQIDLNEIEEKIVLPHPKNFINCEVMTTEEKNNFWKAAFSNKQSISPNLFNGLPSSIKDLPECSIFTQPQTTGSTIRDDEGLRFSQLFGLNKPEKSFGRYHLPPLNGGCPRATDSDSFRPFFSFTNAELSSPKLPLLSTLRAAGLVSGNTERVSEVQIIRIT
jgi:hypothetical protein